MINAQYQVKRELHQAQVFLAELEDAFRVMDDLGYGHPRAHLDDYFRWDVARRKLQDQKRIVMKLESELMGLCR